MPEMGERRQAQVHLEDYFAASAAVPTIRSAARHELLPTEAGSAVTTRSRDNVDFCEIEYSDRTGSFL